MTSVQFYHLTATPLERALPKLLEKAFASGMRTLLLADSDAYAQRLNELLWTYDPASFLPHGGTDEPNAQAQPILVSTQTTPINQASLLVVTSGVIPDNISDFQRVIDIFDGNNPQSLEAARSRWSQYKLGQHELAYMRQTESGGWEKR